MFVFGKEWDMAKSYVLETIGHPSPYAPQIRRFNVYFCLPDGNEGACEPGVLLFIAGFGGNANSNVYKKMRAEFADRYNLITIQCDYFGYEFMQSEVLEENLEYFCEMGPVQAMDNLIALKCLKDYLDENGISYDDHNVIAYGHSHGAYLAYLMNALMPRVLSCIVDNSAWLCPAYLDDSRILKRLVYNGCQETIVETTFSYIIKNIVQDRDIYCLESLYAMIDNKANIFSAHGIEDRLSPVADKIVFLSEVKNSSIEVIGPGRVNEFFQSCEHGLSADFIKMFDYVYHKYITRVEFAVLCFSDRVFETKYARYEIDNSDGIPILYCTLKDTEN